MKKLLVLMIIALSSTSIFAQSNPIQRIKIRHADPALIIMLINGETSVMTQPEMSSFFSGFSGGGFSGGFGGSNRGGLGGGNR